MRILLLLVLGSYAVAAAGVEFTPLERTQIALHGPWPPSLPDDSSNRVSGNAGAIRFGESLFFGHELGGDSRMSCASCHDPGRAFTDGRELGFGRAQLTRNTTGLFNLKGNRWFGWGGEHDSLWAQSIRPIIALDEMASTPLLVKKVVLGSARYRQQYREAFAADVTAHDDETVLVNVAKALAAYQETLFSPRSAFDDFRDALIANDVEAMARYPESAQRGLRIFVGEGRCNACHFGPKFSNGEFADIGIPYFTPDGVDAGRYRGIQRLRENRYNRLGRYNDGDAEQNAIATRQVRLGHGNWGEFRVPGLRDLTLTAPYMHDGSLATLTDVVRHYSELDEDRLHSGSERVLRRLQLSDQQVRDLVAFLRSLSAEE